MVQFSSSQQSGQQTIAATTMTTIFSFAVPKGRQYSLRRSDPDVIDDASQGWPLAIEAIGPCTVTISSKNASATSTTVRAMVQYIDSGGSG